MESIEKKVQEDYDHRISEVSVLTKAAFWLFVLIGVDLYFIGNIRRELGFEYTLVLMVVVSIAVTAHIMYLKKKEQGNEVKSLLYAYIILLNLAATYGFSFLSVRPTPFVFFLMIILVHIRKLFGKKAIFWAMAWYTFVFVGSYFYWEYPLIGLEDLAPTIVGLVATFTMYSYLDGYLQISNDQNVELMATSEKAERERSRLETLVNNINDAVFACDKNFEILLHNPQARMLLDSHESMEGKSLTDLLDIRDADGNHLDVTQLVSAHRRVAIYTNYRLHYSEKDYISLFISVTKVDKENTDRGFVIILRDITHVKSLEEERNEFISIMSHELRTPVSIVEGAVSLASGLVGKVETEKMRGYLDKAHDQTLMLAEIVNSLSTLVNHERNADSIEVSEIDITQIVNKLVDSYSEQAQEKGLAISANIETNLPLVYSSREYIHEIMQNFVTNAVKYTKEGSVEVGAAKHDEKTIKVWVKDTGIGISKADIEHVFEKFWRSDNFETRENNGTGLGLYLVRKLADSVGAKLGIDSEKGKGSTFYMVLPVVISDKNKI